MVPTPQDDGGMPTSSAHQQASEPRTEQPNAPLPDDAQEAGRVTFLYRPRVGLGHVDKLQDVQRFYIILEPTQHAQQQQQLEPAPAAAATSALDDSKAPEGGDKQEAKPQVLPGGASHEQQQQEEVEEKGAAAEPAGPATRSRKRKQATQKQQQQEKEKDQPAPAKQQAAQEPTTGAEEGPKGTAAEQQQEAKELHQARLLVVPKKRLPDGARHERFYGFVEATGDSTSSLTAGLTATSYDTKTSGHREQGPARVVGEGSYLLTSPKGPKGGGSRLVYKLLVPAEPGAAQQTFKVQQTGSIILKVKNPEHKGQPGAPSLKGDPQYTGPQRKRFKGYSWIDADPPSLLGVAATELLLIGSKGEPEDESQAFLDEVYYSDASEVYHSDSELGQGGEQQQEPAALADHLRQHVEPAGEGAAPQGEPVPVAPALTGELV